MDMSGFLPADGEKPLDRIPEDGGYCGIFRTIGVIGDSLAAGEFESTDEFGGCGYNDFTEYSWGKYLGRLVGSEVRVFARGGMTAKEYIESYAAVNGFWGRDKLCQAYIIALGVNDLFWKGMPLGAVGELDFGNLNGCRETFAGCYSAIIQRLKAMQPRARFFLMTMPRSGDESRNGVIVQHAGLIRALAEKFSNTYVIDFERYAPVYDEKFRRSFYLGGHMNPMGYIFTSRITAAYIDFIIRSDMEAFADVGFIGTELTNASAKSLRRTQNE